jgi:hypothetical protein
MNSSSIFTALSVLAAFSTAAAVEPFITTSLRFSSDSKTCDCQFPDKTKVVEEIVTGRCIPTSGKIQSLAVNITGDWNGMLSIEFLYTPTYLQEHLGSPSGIVTEKVTST